LKNTPFFPKESPKVDSVHGHPDRFPGFPHLPKSITRTHRDIFHPAGSFWTISTMEASAVLPVSTQQRTAIYLFAGMIYIPLPTQWLRRTTFLRNRNNR
jgi:hypothetical protein